MPKDASSGPLIGKLLIDALAGHPDTETTSAVVAYVGNGVPVEVILAAGFSPNPIDARLPVPPGAVGCMEGEHEAEIRTLFKAITEGAARDCALLIVPGSTDGYRFLYQYLKEEKRRGNHAIPPLVMFDILFSPRPSIRDHVRRQVGGLSTRLAAMAGRAVDDAAVNAAISRTNAYRRDIVRLNVLRSAQHISGAQAHAIHVALRQLPPEALGRALASVKTPKASGGLPSVLLVPSSAEIPHEIFDVLGLPVVTAEWWGGMIAAKRKAGEYLDALNRLGYHSGLGIYNTLGLASFLAEIPDPPWGGLPKPALLAAPHRDLGGHRLYEIAADRIGAPFFGFEVPASTRYSPGWWREARDNWEDVYEPHRIDLMQIQYHELLEIAQDISGRRFDPDALRDTLARVNEQESYFDAARDLVATAPKSPVRLSEQMSNTMTAQWHRGSDWAVAHARAFHDEVAERVVNGDCVTSRERTRLMWVGVGLWQNTDFYAAFEDSHGAVFVWSMYMAIAADGYIRHGTQDPVRTLAARYLNLGEQMHAPPWAGEWMVAEAKRHRVDGVVMLVSGNQRHQIAGSAYQRREFEAAGIPVCELSVDPSDNRAWDETAMRRVICGFLDREFAR